jgi:hypothetical protein
MGVKGYNGQLEFDGQMVTISRRGFVARMTIGKGEKRVPLRSIAAVQWKPAGIVNGYIEFTIPGGNERQAGGLGRQTHRASSNENSITFTRRQQAAFSAIRDEIEQAMSQLGQG